MPFSLRQRVKSARSAASWYDLSLMQRKRLNSAFQRVAISFGLLSVCSRRSGPRLASRFDPCCVDPIVSSRSVPIVETRKKPRISPRSAVLGLMLSRQTMLSRCVSRSAASARRMRSSFGWPSLNLRLSSRSGMPRAYRALPGQDGSDRRQLGVASSVPQRLVSLLVASARRSSVCLA